MAEEEKTKTRHRLTVTAMYEAVQGLYFAVVGEAARSKQDPPMISITAKSTDKTIVYVVGLFARVTEEPFVAGTLIAEGEHPDGIEEAVAVLLSKMQELFDAKKKELLAEFDAVKNLHHGALKGARSKIREKKT